MTDKLSKKSLKVKGGGSREVLSTLVQQLVVDLAQPSSPTHYLHSALVLMALIGRQMS